MPTRHSTQARRESVQRHREKMRSNGFRMLQIWVPDTTAPGFAEECRRQSLVVAADPSEKAFMDEWESLQDTTG